MQNVLRKPLAVVVWAGLAAVYGGNVWAEEATAAGAADRPVTELVLTNGDRIKGSLVRVDSTSLVWKSDSFGNLTIKKEKVANFSTQEEMKVQGASEHCLIDGMEGYYVNYRCGENEARHTATLMTLDSIVPAAHEDIQKPRSTGKVSVAGTYQRGNTVEDDLEAKGNTSYRHGDWRHNGVLEYESESTNGGPADEDYDLAYRLDRFVSAHWFIYNELGYGQEESKYVDERYTYGLGAGFQVWEDPNSALSFENGVLYKKELLDPTADDLLDDNWVSRTETGYYRFSTNFRYKLPFSAEFFHTNELLYSLQDSENWEVSVDVGLSVPLGLGLFSEYKFEYDYDNQPSSPEAEREDTKWSIGIGYNW